MSARKKQYKVSFFTDAWHELILDMLSRLGKQADITYLAVEEVTPPPVHRKPATVIVNGETHTIDEIHEAGNRAQHSADMATEELQDAS